MSKKLQLTLNLIVIFIVIALIPLSIWATSVLNLSISNTIRFDVEDIEGYLSYQITGDSNPETNFSYAPGNVFTASYNDQEDRYVLQNPNGDEILDGQISLVGNGLTFDHEHTLITYSFLFHNTGEKNVNLSVSSDFDAEINLALNNVATTFKYEMFLSELTIIQQLPTFSENAVTPAEKSFTVVINKKNEISNAYSYILFTYQLDLTNLSTESFTTAISLNINLQSVTN